MISSDLAEIMNELGDRVQEVGTREAGRELMADLEDEELEFRPAVRYFLTQLAKQMAATPEGE